MLNKQLAYLVGLICARGHIFEKDKRIIVEFAHKNKNITGIAYCPNCDSLATEKKDNNPEGNLICKSCGSEIGKSVKKIYEQQESTILSLNKTIIPYLKSYFNTSFEIVGNDHMTLLIMEFEKEKERFNEIMQMFNGTYNFDSFLIPKEIYSAIKENKIEFVTGFLDAAGFFNSGGWLNRDGKNGIGRMRAYFQIVRNWHMPVLICNFLKDKLKLPIHTIDWGHPNIRDSKMEDYFNSNHLSWSREHQVKFFPEYYKIFNLRIKHKQEMFKELIKHNEKVGFDNSDDCLPPKPISSKTLKPYHYGENDPRIPLKIRKHYDAYWQVCNDLGCIFSKTCLKSSKNSEVYYLTGKNNNLILKDVSAQYVIKRKELTNQVIEKYKNHKVRNKQTNTNFQKSNPEQKLYGPVSEWLKKFLMQKYSQEAVVYNTSSFYLDKFILQNNLFDQFNFCDEYKIKPDIVGFLLNSKRLIFVEVKIGQLTLKDMGQLLGYCLVAQPEMAILTSPEKPPLTLMKILKSNPEILNYSKNKRIIISYWENNKFQFLDY